MGNPVGFPVHIDPSTIVGWRLGRSFDVSAGAADGFVYPKNQRRYDSVQDIQDSSDFGANKDLTTISLLSVRAIYQHAQSVMESIQTVKVLDEPLTVYSLGGKNYLLHGALRLSCIAVIKKSDPELFDDVPVIFFEGSPSEARRSMIDFQTEMERKTRALTLQEQVRAVGYMVAQGVEKKSIVKYMRWGRNHWYVDAMLHLDKTETDEQLDAKEDEIQNEEKADATVESVRSSRYQEILREACQASNGRKFKKSTPSDKALAAMKKGSKHIATANKHLSSLYDEPGFDAVMNALQDLSIAYGDFKAAAIQAINS